MFRQNWSRCIRCWEYIDIPGTLYKSRGSSRYLFPYIQLSFLIVICFILFADAAYDAAGHPVGDGICRNIASHHTSGSDYGIIPDRNSGHNLGAGTDPDIPSYMNRKVINIVMLAKNRQNRMTGSTKDNICG